MAFTYSNSLEFSWHVCLMSLMSFKKLKVTEDFTDLGCWSISFKTLILNIIVFLCTPKSATNLTNFSFSWNRLNIFPWWYTTDIMPFLFVRRISSYFLIISAASSGFFTVSTSSFNSSVSIVSLLTSEFISCFLISSVAKLFVLLVFSEPFHN